MLWCREHINVEGWIQTKVVWALGRMREIRNSSVTLPMDPAGPLYTDVPEAQVWCHCPPPPEPTVSSTFSDTDPDTVLVLSPLIPLRIQPGLCYAFCHFSLGCFHSLCLRWPSHHLKYMLCVSYILCFVESAVSFRLDWDYMVLAGTQNNEPCVFLVHLCRRVLVLALLLLMWTLATPFPLGTSVKFPHSKISSCSWVK